MTDNYKEFDERFRAMLENAEEDVPPQCSDNVFARLDAISAAEGRKRVLPLWLRSVSAVSAVAAAVLLAVVLWPDNNEETLVAEDIAVVKERSGEVLADIPEATRNNAQEATRNNAQEEGIATPNNMIYEKLVPQEVKDIDASPAPEVLQAGETEPGADTIIDNEAVTESESPAGSETTPSPDNDTDDEGGYIDWNEPEETRKAGKAAIVLGGDLSSNGDAKSLGRFSGLRAPAAGLLDRTWIEQTGKDSRYAIPVSVGIGARYQFARRWSVGLGVNYTMLSRTFSGVYTRIENGITIDRISTDIKHTIQYIGIPVNVYYSILDSKRVKFYAYGGGAVDFPVSNRYKVKASQVNVVLKEKVNGAQYSVGAGIGVEFMLAKHLGLYLDPGICYYFDSDQPVSIRTQQPLMMNFELGFRFDI